MTVLIRIALRAVAWLLIGKGLPKDIGMMFEEPALVEWVELGIGSALAVSVEYWYVLAKRMGWRT